MKTKLLTLAIILFSTIVAFAQSPGGVSSNLGWWFKGDAGFTTGSTVTWKDQSSSGLDVKQATASRQPINTNFQNFNPVVTFDGSDALQATSGFWRGKTGVGAYNFFAVTKHTKGVPTSPVNTVYHEATSTTSGNVFFNDNAGNLTVGAFGVAQGTAPFTTAMSGVPQLYANRFSSGSSLRSLSANSVPLTLTNTASYPTFNGNASGVLTLGNFSDQASWPFQGDVAEVIMYGSDVSSTSSNLAKIQSYLAVKWGITLTPGVATDYVNSSSTPTTIWTGNTTYQNNVAGIARDDMGGTANSGLVQKQSQSVNTGDQIIIGIGTVANTNALNGGTFASDQQALVWGDNALTGTSAFTVGSSTYVRLNRVWKAQNTSTNALNQTVQVLCTKCQR